MKRQARNPAAREAGPPASAKATRNRARGQRELLVLAGMTLVAVGLRAWSVARLAHDWRIDDPVMDGLYYMTTARRLAQGLGWPPGPIFMTPFYPFVLSLLFRLAPPGVLTVQVFQSILGLGTLALLVRAARRDLGSTAAWILAGLYLLCAPVLEMESEALTEVLLLFLAAAALEFWPGAGPDGGRRGWRNFVFGLTCGCLTIGRGVFLLLPAAALAHLWFARRTTTAEGHEAGNRRASRRAGIRLRPAALTVAGILLALLPLATYQTRATGHLELLTLNGGLNLYVGNNPVARGTYSAPPEIDLEADPTAARSASLLAGRSLDLVDSDRFWRSRAFAFMRGRPGRFLWLLGRKALLFLSPREIPQLQDFQDERRECLPLRIAFIDFAWLLPLAALGLAAAVGPGGARRHPRTPLRLAPWLILAGTGWISTILFFATGRYRIPFLAGFLGLAALGVQAAVAMLRARRLHWTAALLPAVAVLQWLLPSYSAAQAKAHDDFQHGGYLLRRGEPARALEVYRDATRVWPEGGAGWHGAGVALVTLGRLPEAVEAYQTACRWLPNSAVTHYDLASVFGRLGRDAQALGEFEEAVRLDPLDPRFRTDMAVALARTGKRDEAIRNLREVMQRNPEYLPARNDLQALGLRP